MRRLLVMLAIMLLAAPCVMAEKTVTMTFVGDCTLGSEERLKDAPDSYVSMTKSKGYDYFFANVRHLFENDDLTIVNLESVLSNSAAQENKNKTYRFRGTTDMVQILTGSSVEICNLTNNHTLDYGEQGIASTKETLDANGVAWFSDRDYYVAEAKGVKIAFFSLQPSSYMSNKEYCADEIRRLKEEDGVSAVVFVFHAGEEYNPHRVIAQERFAKFAIDAGADLVIMHHPHVIQGLEIINHRTVCYSLGNFSFGGNSKVRSLDTVVIQVDMTFSDNGVYLGQQLRIYPAHISDDAELNHYQPVLMEGKEADAVMAHLQQDSSFHLNPYDPELGYALQNYLPADPSMLVTQVNAPGEYPKR